MTRDEILAAVAARKYMRRADLSDANLSGADLRDANLRDANLRDAAHVRRENVPVLAAARSSITPETGAFDGWKKCRGGVIVHVRIPASAKRSSAAGRKCRAERVKVLDVFGADHGISIHDGKTKYVKGKTVKCDVWNEDRWVECGGGIHFFLTRAEAEAYS